MGIVFLWPYFEMGSVGKGDWPGWRWSGSLTPMASCSALRFVNNDSVTAEIIYSTAHVRNLYKHHLTSP